MDRQAEYQTQTTNKQTVTQICLLKKCPISNKRSVTGHEDDLLMMIRNAYYGIQPTYIFQNMDKFAAEIYSFHVQNTICHFSYRLKL